MKGHGTKFGQKMEEAIAALLTQRNIEEAAKAVGIAPNTLLNWMKVPEFQVAYREARQRGWIRGRIVQARGRGALVPDQQIELHVLRYTPARLRPRRAFSLWGRRSANTASLLPVRERGPPLAQRWLVWCRRACAEGQLDQPQLR